MQIRLQKGCGGGGGGRERGVWVDHNNNDRIPAGLNQDQLSSEIKTVREKYGDYTGRHHSQTWTYV